MVSELLGKMEMLDREQVLVSGASEEYGDLLCVFIAFVSSGQTLKVGDEVALTHESHRYNMGGGDLNLFFAEPKKT